MDYAPVSAESLCGCLIQSACCPVGVFTARLLEQMGPDVPHFGLVCPAVLLVVCCIRPKGFLLHIYYMATWHKT